MEPEIMTQRYSLGGILSEGLQVYRSEFLNVLLIITCILLPLDILLSFIPGLRLEAVRSWGTLFASTAILLVQLVFRAVATVCLACLVEKAVIDEPIAWSQAVKSGLSRFWSLVTTGIVAGLILAGLTICLIVPGIIWGVYYSFGIFVVSLRNMDNKAALDYSKRLVKGQWWRVFGYGVAIGVVYAVASFIAVLLLGVFTANPFALAIHRFLLDVLFAAFATVSCVWFLNNDYLVKSVSIEKSRPTVENTIWKSITKSNK